jgi:predicted nucleic acid-binding protein
LNEAVAADRDMSLFVDTSVWYAAMASADPSNSRAREILSTVESLYTTDHVLVETWSLLQRRIHHKAAERFWEGLRSGIAVVEPVGLADLETAWQIGQIFPDQAFSLADRTSFAVMRRLGIERVASLDHHFAVFRYGPKQRHAFEIVR